jgi:hypothetical protein
MKILRLHLKKEWWEQIRDDKKNIEYRRTTPYWHKRLIGKQYDEIHLLLGYPKKGDDSRIIKRIGYLSGVETITHKEFGDEPVEVFVIDISQKIT